MDNVMENPRGRGGQVTDTEEGPTMKDYLSLPESTRRYGMPTAKGSGFFCQECGHAFRTLKGAERAMLGPGGCSVRPLALEAVGHRRRPH